ncbi:MAG: glycosyltransferase family 4 protein [Xanthobacteraceae bacterium]
MFAVPGDLATPTGGYAYDRRIIAELPDCGWHASVLALGDGFPRPAARAHAAACARLTALPAGPPVVVDGLAFGVLPDAAQAMERTHRVVALVHHPLALESGLSVQDAETFRTSERRVLAHSRHVVATSQATARVLETDYGVARERISVVEPGTDRGTAVRKTGETGRVALLAVGAVVPRKGYDLLIAALAQLKHLSWRLTIAGDRTRDPKTTREVEVAIARFDLADRIEMPGSVSDERLSSLYASADLFVLPSRFEGYGMAYAEALAHGLPVVATNTGAIPDTVPAEAGVLVPPDNVQALAASLARIIEQPAERARLATAARAARFPSWREQAAKFAQVLERLA